MDLRDCTPARGEIGRQIHSIPFVVLSVSGEDRINLDNFLERESYCSKSFSLSISRIMLSTCAGRQERWTGIVASLCRDRLSGDFCLERVSCPRCRCETRTDFSDVVSTEFFGDMYSPL